MDYLRNTLIYKIRGVRKKMVTASKQALEEINLTLELYVALHFTYENPGLSQKELADLVWTDSNVVVRMVDKLEEMGLMRRQHRKDDRRAYSLYVTDEGEKVANEYWQKLIDYQEECLASLSASERQDFKRYLNVVLGEDGTTAALNTPPSKFRH